MKGLSQSQKSIVDQAVEFVLEGNGKPIVIESMSGLGKTTVAQAIAELTQREIREIADLRSHLPEEFGENTLLVIDLGAEELIEVIEEIRDLIQETQAIILSNTGRRPAGSENAEIVQVLWDNDIEDFEHLEIKAMSDQETEELARTLKPEITEEEIALVKKYSLGIPLLVEGLTKKEDSLTEEESKFILKGYLYFYFYSHQNK